MSERQRVADLISLLLAVIDDCDLDDGDILVAVIFVAITIIAERPDKDKATEMAIEWLQGGGMEGH